MIEVTMLEEGAEADGGAGGETRAGEGSGR